MVTSVSQKADNGIFKTNILALRIELNHMGEEASPFEFIKRFLLGALSKIHLK